MLRLAPRPRDWRLKKIQRLNQAQGIMRIWQTDIDISTLFDSDKLTINLIDDVIYDFALTGH